MGRKMDRFKAAFRSKSSNKAKYARRKGEVEPLVTELYRLLGLLGGFTGPDGSAHPSYDRYSQKIGDIGVEFAAIDNNSAANPATAWSDLGPFKKKAQALVDEVTQRVADIEKMRAGGEHAFEDLHFGGLKVVDPKSASGAALAAQKALDALVAKAADLPPSLSGSKKRIDKDIERVAREFGDVNRHASVPAAEWRKKHALAEAEQDATAKRRLVTEANTLAETYEAHLKQSIKAYGKVGKLAEKLLRQITTLAENQVELGVTIGMGLVNIDKRAIPGVDDMDEEERRLLLAKVGQKIERGKALADKVLDSSVDLDELPDPTTKEVADILWYLKTLAEQKVGEPYEKGALTIPDPGNRLRKYLDRCGAVYTRGSSHMTELREEDPTGGKEPRGMDFYKGNTSDNIDELLPFGMNTALMQSFEMGGEDRLYLKMETEGSRTPPVQAFIGMVVGGLLALGPALVGGLIGGIGGAIAPGSSFKQGAAKGAELGAKPFMHLGNTVMQGLMEFPLWNPGGHAWDAIKTAGKSDMPSARTSTPKDWYNTAEHGLNLLRSMAGAHNDGLGSFREKLGKQKTLLGEKISHPAVTAYKAVITATKGGPNLGSLGEALDEGPWNKNVGQMITNLGGVVRAIDELAQANDRAWDQDGAALLVDADLEAIPKHGRICRITSMLKTLIAGADTEQEGNLPGLMDTGETLRDQSAEQLGHIAALRKQIDTDPLVRAGMAAYPDVSLLTDPPKFKRELAAIVATSREYIDQIRMLERVAGDAHVDVESLEFELRGICADRLRQTDHELFSPQDVVNELETQQETLEQIVDPLNELVQALTTDSTEMVRAISLLGSGLEVGDERFVKAVTRLRLRNNERLRQLLSWSSQVAPTCAAPTRCPAASRATPA
jgi:hypothetical protein